MKSLKTAAAVTMTAGLGLALAMPGVASAEDGPTDNGGAGQAMGVVAQINAPELTAVESDGITTVTFTPDEVGGDIQCMGPWVMNVPDSADANADDLPSSVTGLINFGVDNSDMYAIPKGFADANSGLIEDYVDSVYVEGETPSREALAQFGTLTMLMPLSAVGEPMDNAGDSPYMNANPSSYMDRTAEHNAFGYELDPDYAHMAMAFCFAPDPDDPDSRINTESYFTYINDGDGTDLVFPTTPATVYRQGAAMYIKYSGLTPRKLYGPIFAHSEKFCTLDKARADEDGNITLLCMIPEDVSPGTHHFYLKDGSDTVASIEFEVSDDGADAGLLSANAGDSTGGDETGGDNTGGDTTSGTGSLGSLFGSLGSA